MNFQKIHYRQKQIFRTLWRIAVLCIQLSPNTFVIHFLPPGYKLHSSIHRQGSACALAHVSCRDIGHSYTHPDVIFKFLPGK